MNLFKEAVNAYNIIKYIVIIWPAIELISHTAISCDFYVNFKSKFVILANNND